MIRVLFVLLLFCGPVQAQNVLQTSAGPVRVTPVATGLDEPWAVGFLPGGGILITERGGSLLLGTSGQLRRVSGVPAVLDQGQGGLLDVVVARDFETSREIFLSYSEPRVGGSGTALAVATLDQDAARLSDVKTIFRQRYASNKLQHFGSRIVEARDGSLYLTIGDRGVRDQAQDLNRHNGSVIRVNRDGSVPGNNPFVSGGGLPEIWSYGHRNPQGAALDLSGNLWTVEHGAQGGDEVNRPEAGKNYGWPVISYGVHYSGRKIGLGTSNAGMEQPEHFWDPSMAPSGMMIYSGRLWPAWKGDIFVGSLKFNYISRLDGAQVKEDEQLFLDEFTRIRDVREAPDGTIWFLSVVDGALYRISPA